MPRYIDVNAFWRRLTSKVEDDAVDLMVVCETLDEMQTADVVEVKHGKWQWKEDIDFMRDIPEDERQAIFRCSECHTKTIVWAATLRRTLNEWHYCPYCGSKMEIEQKES